MPDFRLARSLALAALCCTVPAAAQEVLDGPAERSPTPRPIGGVLTIDTVAVGLSRPWGLAFLPDGRMLVTEKEGRFRVVSKDGRVSSPLGGAPKVQSTGQGGLLDVILAPDFERSRRVYFSFSEPGEGGTAGTSVARARLNQAGDALEDVRVIYRQQPKLEGSNHFGSRLAFAPDGTLFIGQGDRFDYKEQAQEPGSLVGKLVRVNADGSVPRDNPFVGRQGVRPEIWSLGHRNIQGVTLEPGTDRVWTIEHGPLGGDELHRPEAGTNYGWPVITYGVNYDGTKVGEGITEREGMEQPLYYWNPVIAPSAMTFLSGDRYPEWKGDLLISSLVPGGVVRLELDDDEVVKEERYLQQLSRLRWIGQGRDGYAYVLTDGEDGRLLRLLPGRRASEAAGEE